MPETEAGVTGRRVEGHGRGPPTGEAPQAANAHRGQRYTPSHVHSKRTCWVEAEPCIGGGGGTRACGRRAWQPWDGGG